MNITFQNVQVYTLLTNRMLALQVIATTGPDDPRRKPLIDLSNGDYSDLRKHLQHISSHLHPHHHHHHLPHNPYLTTDLPPYLQPFAPRSTNNHHHHNQHGYHIDQVNVQLNVCMCPFICMCKSEYVILYANE